MSRASGKRIKKPFSTKPIDTAKPDDRGTRLSNVDKGKDAHSREDLETYRPNYIKPHR